MERRVNVRGIPIDDEGRVFAVKHRKREGGESEYWATIGGGLDPVESLQDGLVREFIEEVGIKPVVGRLLFVQQFIAHHRDGRKTEKLEFIFHVENVNDYKTDIDLSATSHGYELARAEFIDPSSSDLLPLFLQTTNIRNHIDTNQPVIFVNNLDKEFRR